MTDDVFSGRTESTQSGQNHADDRRIQVVTQIQRIKRCLPVIRMGERGSYRAWLWIGRSLSLPVQTILPLA